MIPRSGEAKALGTAESTSLRLLPAIDQRTAMALRAGFAAASLLGVVTTVGTTLWIATVVILVVLIVGLSMAELLPRLRVQQNSQR
jgi:hypothetical protein